MAPLEYLLSLDIWAQAIGKLIALLQPGENVLEALRRLGQSRFPAMQQ